MINKNEILVEQVIDLLTINEKEYIKGLFNIYNGKKLKYKLINFLEIISTENYRHIDIRYDEVNKCYMEV